MSRYYATRALISYIGVAMCIIASLLVENWPYAIAFLLAGLWQVTVGGKYLTALKKACEADDQSRTPR